MEKKSSVVSSGSQLLLAEKGAGLFSTVLCYGEGVEKQLPATTPAKDLIAAAEIDYRTYRREIKRLRDGHPLFAARLDIPVADFEDFVAEALLLPSMLQKVDPVSFFVLGELLDRALQREDDGSALFLLNVAEELLYVLEDPIRTQVCLRNILEMTFDGMERALYFQQDKQRIARCDYCWGWFIPKTKKATRYCDRVTDGFPCKQRGARFKRNLVKDQDGALKVCNQLRDRAYARLLRWQNAAPGERDKLIPMDYGQYDAWSENARLARMEYLKGKLAAEEFLRRIDTTHELKSYETDRVEQVGQTDWQQRVAGDISFDPKFRYPETIQCLDFDPGAAEPKWEIYTADHLRKQDQQGHQSLREKYGKR